MTPVYTMDSLFGDDDLSGRLEPLTTIETSSAARQAAATTLAEFDKKWQELLGPTRSDAIDLQQAMGVIDGMMSSVYWQMGDRILHSIDPDTGMNRMSVYRAASRGMRRSIRWAIELAKVAAAFPPEHRYADVDWTIYRACANTGSRTPLEWLNRAIAENLSAKGIDHYDNVERVSML